MSIIVPTIVIAIVAFQFYFFRKNLARMNEYGNIFEKETSWGLRLDGTSNYVTGITGEGNPTFFSIKKSINKYLSNNAGAVIDFQLLKDAVDRHCEAVESDVHTLTPIPLYCGLAGTMAGVIVGLYSLLATGSITDLLSSGSSNFSTAAVGVNDLLEGVAWAMVASIFGIILTTFASIKFKSQKVKGEAGKNAFLAWLQAELLPKLPTDISQALKDLVGNLNTFNSAFAYNTDKLQLTLNKVNASYQTQAEIINTIHEMDVMKMAKANVNVLHELQNCTVKLEQFNEYLDSIEGYTDAIHKFETLFEKESRRLQVLEEIRNYFTRYKGEISKYVGDADAQLGKALNELTTNASSNVNELNKVLTEQAGSFKAIIKEQGETFEGMNRGMVAQFNKQLEKIPMLEKRLSAISEIPSRLDLMIEKIDKSNAEMLRGVAQAMSKTAQDFAAAVEKGRKAEVKNIGGISLPQWMTWTFVISAIVIAVSCMGSAIYNFTYAGNSEKAAVEFSTEKAIVSDTIFNDTTALDTANKQSFTPTHVPIKKSSSHNRRKKHAK